MYSKICSTRSSHCTCKTIFFKLLERYFLIAVTVVVASASFNYQFTSIETRIKVNWCHLKRGGYIAVEIVGEPILRRRG